MVGATRGTPEGFRADQASGSQQPPAPTSQFGRSHGPTNRTS
jgi:hypothetical protein